NVFLVTAAVSVLDRWTGDGVRPWVALLLAVCALLSFGSGLLALVLVPVGMVAARIDRPLRSRAVRAAAVAAAAAACVAVYLADWEHPSHHPTMLALFSDPESYASYVLAFLGSGLGALVQRVAIEAGGIGVVAFVACSTWLWVASRDRRSAVLPWLLL